MSIIVSGTLHVAPAQRAAYLEARVPILEHARQAPGCLDFSLSADLLDPGRVNVYERWRSREDLLAYRSGSGPDLDRLHRAAGGRRRAASHQRERGAVSTDR